MPGIWIRSQDKMALIPIGTGGYFPEVIDNSIRATMPTAGYPLGRYATKERALQVLDEIQARIEEYKKDEIYIEHGWEDADDLKTVYQMPEE